MFIEKESTNISMMTVLKAASAAFIWPIKFLLSITVPDCRKENLRRFYPITFIMCIIWIGISSYLNSWMMTIIGKLSAVGTYGQLTVCIKKKFWNPALEILKMSKGK